MESRQLSHNNQFTHMIQTLKAIEPTNSNTYYKPNARCAYHSNSLGHYTNNCRTLKNKIQDLISKGEINSHPPETPMVIPPPMPSCHTPKFALIYLRMSFSNPRRTQTPPHVETTI